MKEIYDGTQRRRNQPDQLRHVDADGTGSGGSASHGLVFLGIDILDDEPDESADEHNHDHPVDDADRDTIDTIVAHRNPGCTENTVIG